MTLYGHVKRMNPGRLAYKIPTLREIGKNSFPIAEKHVRNLSKGEKNPVEIRNRAVFRKEVVGLRNNTKRQHVKMQNTFSVEEQ